MFRKTCFSNALIKKIKFKNPYWQTQDMISVHCTDLCILKIEKFHVFKNKIQESIWTQFTDVNLELTNVNNWHSPNLDSAE